MTTTITQELYLELRRTFGGLLPAHLALKQARASIALREKLQAQIAAPDWPALMDTPAFLAYCAATERADEAERRSERED